MEDVNLPSEENILEEEEHRSAHSPRTWRTCCLVPVLATVAVLLIALTASLFSPAPQKVGGPQTRDDPALQRRQAFVDFGKRYFEIASRADKLNEAAFQEIQDYADKRSALGDVHDAFRKASAGNGKAAEEFRGLEVPANLLSQPRLRQSLDIMAEAYEARRRACETILAWNGDMEDSKTAAKYARQAQEINRLTLEGLRHLEEAATDNGLTRDDVEKFLPAAGLLRGKEFGDALLPPGRPR